MTTFLKGVGLSILVGVATLAAPAPGTAQDRGFLSINGGLQATSNDFSDTVDFELYVEQGTYEVEYPIDGGAIFDVSLGARVRGDFGLGFGVSNFGKEDPADVSASLPHPFFFDRDRQIQGQSEPLQRSETVVHVLAMWFVPASETVEVALFAGPSFFRVEQDVVTDVRFSESFPFDTASFAGVDVDSVSENAVGFNVGADIGVYLTRHVGFGALLRFSRASVDVPTAPGTTVSADAGGFHVGGGLRVRF